MGVHSFSLLLGWEFSGWILGHLGFEAQDQTPLCSLPLLFAGLRGSFPVWKIQNVAAFLENSQWAVLSSTFSHCFFCGDSFFLTKEYGLFASICPVNSGGLEGVTSAACGSYSTFWRHGSCEIGTLQGQPGKDEIRSPTKC